MPDVFQKLCDQCNECEDCCCRSIGPCEIFSKLSDKNSSIKTQTRNNTPSLNEALIAIADDFDDLDENTDEGYNLERDDVCTGLVTNKSELTLDFSPNPDSDRDSGCFSEEQNLMEGVIKQRVYSFSRSRCVTECDIDTPASADCGLGEAVTYQPSIRHGLASEICKPSHRRHLSARPFHRKIWKRRNGWYKVRQDGTLSSSLLSQPTNYAHSDSQQLRSQLSGPGLELLRDTAAKECETDGEKQNITFEQELSDNDPDNEDTTESDAERITSPSSSLYSGESIADILSNMRLEIARMVAESAEASSLVEREEQAEWSASDGLSSQPEDLSSEAEDEEDSYYLDDSEH